MSSFKTGPHPLSTQRQCRHDVLAGNVGREPDVNLGNGGTTTVIRQAEISTAAPGTCTKQVA